MRLINRSRLSIWLVLLLISVVTAACQTPVAGVLSGTTMPTAVTILAPSATPIGGAACELPTIQAPPYPDITPVLNQIDPATGLHVTGALRHINLATYRLKVTGAVSQTLELT